MCVACGVLRGAVISISSPATVHVLRSLVYLEILACHNLTENALSPRLREFLGRADGASAPSKRTPECACTHKSTPISPAKAGIGYVDLRQLGSSGEQACGTHLLGGLPSRRPQRPQGSHGSCAAFAVASVTYRQKIAPHTRRPRYLGEIRARWQYDVSTGYRTLFASHPESALVAGATDRPPQPRRLSIFACRYSPPPPSDA
ncbi:hypothetical protein GY45DRAFT_415700 [Cubamyces sp. BRFM 1775]|nr:hypothetical protein GY45DRAFT_415700 [Cubamyces sp. BRFM 1775]